MESSDRLSLVDALSRVGTGCHLGFIHEGQDEPLAVVLPFLQIGLARGEKCICIAPDDALSKIATALRSQSIDVEAAIKTGSLALTRKPDAYPLQGQVDPDEIIRFWARAIEEASAAGFSGLRGTSEMAWALGDVPDLAVLLQYESKLNTVVRRNPATFLCQYDRRRFAPEVILEVIRTHPLLIYKGRVCENAYYLPREELLSARQPALEAERLLRNILDRETANQALRESEVRLRAILHHSPSSIFLKDLQGRYLACNPPFAQLCARSQEQIIGKTDRELFPEELAAQFQINDRKVLAAGTAMQFEETTLCAGEPCICVVSKFPLRDAPGVIYALGGIATDITERKHAEEAREKQTEVLQTIFDHIPVMINFVGRDGRIKLINREWERRIGWSLEEIQRQNINVLAEAYPDAADYREVMKFISEASGKWKDFQPKVKAGRKMDTAWAIVRLSDGTSIGIGQDITKRKQAEEALRAANERLQHLSARVLNVQETERRSIARELHDEIGQLLTATKLNLQAAQDSDEPAAVNALLQESISSLDRLLDQVRNLWLDLRPPMLDDLGLVAALRWYVRQLGQRAGLRVEFAAEFAERPVESAWETACFRVAQEALTNVVRHARAKNVFVQLRRQGKEVRLLVRDDGTGFDAAAAKEEARHGASLGLLGMEERIRLAGGRCAIESSRGRGTEIHAIFPLEDGFDNSLEARKGP